MADHRPVVFVGNARDYHTMDWCRAIHPCLLPDSWFFFTDCVESEGHIRIVNQKDQVRYLLLIDPFLLKEQSVKANIWRNFLKLLLSPFQAVLLRIRIGNPSGRVIHAHTFYYGMLCRMANIPYLFTPQGGELTERPKESALYRRLMRWTLSGAKYTFVDSQRMKQTANELGCTDVAIYQYGIDTAACQSADTGLERWRLVSNRGIQDNYRIEHIQFARDSECDSIPLTFFYPLWEQQYWQAFRQRLRPGDQDLGRIDKEQCYKLYAESRLVISIPESDSSPRSVYEAIFCGAPVVTTPSLWVDDLPASMRRRVLLVDPKSVGWLRQALIWADECIRNPFEPCTDAISRYDQYGVAREIFERFYRPLLGSDPKPN